MMIPFARLGLASSVAKAQDYSWTKTLELVKQFNFRHVQLYLNTSTLDDLHFNVLQQAAIQYKLHLHLPVDVKNQTLQSFLFRALSELDSEIVLIQHEAYLDKTWSLLSHLNKVTLGLENDAVNNTPQDFLNHFVELTKHHHKLIPVIDVSRFFVQAPQDFTSQQTAQQIQGLFLKLQEQNQPFIIHAIDHPACTFQHQFWKPLFEGDLPWDEILKIVHLRFDLLKCLMFEYENWNMVRKSLANMMGKKN